jgi:erythromycin esterase-like protein
MITRLYWTLSAMVAWCCWEKPPTARTSFIARGACITRRLIREKGFTAVAVEAAWPDAQRVNRYVQGRGQDRASHQALDNFRRFPARHGEAGVAV